jgi:hypothetical protein
MLLSKRAVGKLLASLQAAISLDHGMKSHTTRTSVLRNFAHRLA